MGRPFGMSLEFTGWPDAVNDRLAALEARVLALESARVIAPPPEQAPPDGLFPVPPREI